MRFYGGRISLLAIKPNLFYAQGNEKKFDLVTKLLSKRVEFKVRKDTTIIIEPILDSNGMLLGGKIGRESIRNLPLSKQLTKTPTKMYPYVLFILDEREQLCLIQRNAQVFNDELVVFKYLLRYLNRELYIKGIEADTWSRITSLCKQIIMADMALRMNIISGRKSGIHIERSTRQTGHIQGKRSR